MLYNGGNAKVLIVDDLETNRIILSEILSGIFEIEQADNGMDAISIMLNSIEKPKLLLLDIMMPGMDGFRVMKLMKATPELQKIPIILITAADAEKKGLSAGAVDYISKPFDPDIVKLRALNQVELTMYRESLESMVEQKANELLNTKQLFLDTMANLIEYRSIESGSHVNRTRELAKILFVSLMKDGGYANEVSQINFDIFLRAVPLHDIGKIGIPDSILLKPGKLTPDEFEIIKTHTTIGAKAIASMMINYDDTYMKYCHDICRYHHEKWDGNGYPEGLHGQNIPLVARIVAVIDVYDALVSERCYKKALTHEEAMSIIRQSSGNHFDPYIVKVLESSQDEVRALY